MSIYSSPSPIRLSSEPLLHQLQRITDGCIQCQRCVAECRFLQRYGNPKTIAEACASGSSDFSSHAFECSLCELCTAVCPKNLDMRSLFLELRRDAFARGGGRFQQHKRLLGFEAKGTSQRFSWYALPEGCDTIFFPGCGLPGTRPEQTLKTYDLLQRSIPTAGIVLDCCTKPSHDLGRQEYFLAMFGEMTRFLVDHGVRTVLVACPNCDKVFTEYAPELECRTIYDVLDLGDLPVTGCVAGEVHVHDPCVARFSGRTQEAVRSLTIRQGLTVVETPHSRNTTLCCGKGGASDSLEPELPRGFTEQQARETAGRRTLTYCTGCANRLGDFGPTSHILDLLFSPEATMTGRLKVARAPVTYFNRLKVKGQLQKRQAAAVTRERTFAGRDQKSAAVLKKLSVLAVIVAAIVVACVAQ